MVERSVAARKNDRVFRGKGLNEIVSVLDPGDVRVFESLSRKQFFDFLCAVKSVFVVCLVVETVRTLVSYNSAKFVLLL